MNIFLKNFHLLFFTFFPTAQVFCQQADLNRFDNFVLKHYWLPESLKKDCNFNYAAMLISWNEKERITKLSFLNNAHPDLKKSFEYITRFKFTPSMKLNGRPILAIGCVDQRNTDNCPVLYPYKERPGKVVKDITDLIRKQLEKNPRTIVFGVFTAISPALPIP